MVELPMSSDHVRVRFRAPKKQLSLAEKLRTACDTASFGRELIAMRVRLTRPEATQADIDAEVRGWLSEDPPDDGTPVVWPRARG